MRNLETEIENKNKEILNQWNLIRKHKEKLTEFRSFVN